MTRLIVLVVLAGCGHVARFGYGPAVSADGRFGGEVGVELGTHAMASPVVSMPLAVRLQAAMIGTELVTLVGFTTSIDAGPGFWRVRANGARGQRGPAFRLGGAIGPAYAGGGAAVGMRIHAAIGEGTVEPTVERCIHPTGYDNCDDVPMTLHHFGVELAWSQLLGGPGWLSAEVYWQWSRVPELTTQPSTWLFDTHK